MSELIESIKELLPISSVGIAAAGLTYALAKYLNETLSEDARTRVSLWFLGEAPQFAWQSQLLEVFDALFGEKAVSWKRLRGVAIVTGTVITLVWVFICYRYATDDQSDPDAPTLSDMIFVLLVGQIPAAFLFHMPFDYLAVIKTRFLLRIASQKPQSVFGAIRMLIFDVVTTLTLLLALVMLLIAMVKILQAAGLILADDESSFRLEVDTTLPGTFSLQAFLAQLFTFAFLAILTLPFVHTIWLTVYVLAAILARCATWLTRKLPLLGRILSQKRIEESPVTLIGEFGAVLLLCVFLAAGLFFPRTHHPEAAKAGTSVAYVENAEH